MKKNYKIYLDTNFIRDIMEKRNTKAIHLIETIRNLKNKKKCDCYTSAFLIMELCDAKKDDLFLFSPEFFKLFTNRPYRHRPTWAHFLRFFGVLFLFCMLLFATTHKK